MVGAKDEVSSGVSVKVEDGISEKQSLLIRDLDGQSSQDKKAVQDRL